MDNLEQTRHRTLRIALFGGTFNPVHRGHEQVAQDVRLQFGLDRIYFVPCALPPHKTHGPLAPAPDRMEMVRLALKDQEGAAACDVEIQRSGPSYTIDTLDAFRQRHPRDMKLFFMVGMDAFVEIHTWKTFRKLFELSAFILMARPDSGGSLPAAFGHRALDYARHHISDRYGMAPEGDALIHPEKKPIYLAAVTPVPISSTRIRDMIRRGRPIRQWVNHAVADYIEHKGLYR